MTLLSVNVNKIAVLRNARGGAFPCPLDFVRRALDAGVRGITVHPRPDRRHITAEDVLAIARALPAGVEFNLEGNPFAPERPGYPGLLALAAAARPAQVTFVPDGDGQITSDHGFDPAALPAGLTEQVAAFRTLGARVSLFVDPGVVALGPLRDAGAQRIEIYTGPYAEAHARGDAAAALAAARRSAEAARALGLGVNAGHDLSQQNLADFLANVPGVLEVSIGHALVAEALVEGWATTLARYRAITGG